MPPSSEFQLQFLNKVQLLLESGKFTSTYKFALLIALTNVAVEKGNDSGAALDVDLNDVAREFLSLYWSQARPYKSIGSTLLQNREVNKSAKIISLLAPEVLVSASQHARLRRYNKTRDALVNQTRRLIVKFPLKHLQHLESVSDQKYSRDQFLYELSDDNANNLSLDKIKLKPGVAACLRSLRGLIVSLVQARWAQWVRATNPALGKRWRTRGVYVWSRSQTTRTPCSALVSNAERQMFLHGKIFGKPQRRAGRSLHCVGSLRLQRSFKSGVGFKRRQQR